MADPPLAGSSRHRSVPRLWPLFLAAWLLFPVSFVVEVLRADLPEARLLALLALTAALVAGFLWLMLRYPFPGAELSPPDLRLRIAQLAALAVLALGVELAYFHDGGVPYRFMYVVIAAAVTLPTRQAAWAIVVVTAAAGGVYATQVSGDAAPADWGRLVPFPLVGTGMIFVARLVVTIGDLRAAQQEIARLAVAEERLRLARDLHDLLGHSLSLITLKSELAGRLLHADRERAAAEIADVERVARQSLREVREAVAGLRRPTLDAELAGVRDLLAAAGIQTRIEATAGPLPPAVDAALAWTVREGATNVIRHSRARHCEIRVTREDGTVRAEVTDDGRGAPAAAPKATGSGLSGLAERVAKLDGRLAAGPDAGGGFRLDVALPIAAGTESASVAAGARATGA